MKPKHNSPEISQSSDATNRQVRSEKDKRNLKTLRDKMTLHLGGYRPTSKPEEMGIPGSSTQSGRAMSSSIDGIQFNEEDLKPAPDPGFAKTFYRWATGRDPEYSAYRVSNVTREIIKQGQEIFEQIETLNRDKIETLDKDDRKYIRDLIGKALRQQNLALKEKDGGSGTGDKSNRQDARLELQRIANRLEAWQKYIADDLINWQRHINEGELPPREMHNLPEAEITPKAYYAYHAMRRANLRRPEGVPYNSDVPKIEDRFIEAVKYIEEHRGYIQSEEGEEIIKAIGKIVSGAVKAQQRVVMHDSSGTNKKMALQQFEELTRNVETSKLELQQVIDSWNKDIDKIRTKIEDYSRQVAGKQQQQINKNLMQEYNSEYQRAKELEEKAQGPHDASIGEIEKDFKAYNGSARRLQALAKRICGSLDRSKALSSDIGAIAEEPEDELEIDD